MKEIRRAILCLFMVLVLAAMAVCGNSLFKLQQNEQKTHEQTITAEEKERWAAPDEEVLDYYGLGEFTTTLPVIYINTEGQQILKENKIRGNIALLDENGEEQSILSTPNHLYSATIKYRGASSYGNFDKKQYRIKFCKKNSDKAKNVSLAGMSEHSEWVLNGPYLDKTLMRNKLMYDLARELTGWAPDSRFVELFVDGNYQGVYLAVEPVTNGENRLNLTEFSLLSGKTGYIVKRDRVGTEETEIETYGKLAGYTNNALYLEYPSSKDATLRQIEYVEEDVSAFERALYGDNFADPETGYNAYINVDNWVDYFIINEFAMNYDAGNLSTYAYKDIEGKLNLAVWDFNNGFDNYQWFRTEMDEFQTVENSWFNRLAQDRNFIDKVVARYRELRKSTLSEEHIFRQLAKYEEELGDAVDRNFKVWGYSFKENLLIGKKPDGTSRDIRSYEEAVKQLKTTIRKRLAFMDEHIDEELYEDRVDGKEQ